MPGGEFKQLKNRDIADKSILAVSMDKAIEYSKDGVLIKGSKIPGFTNYLYPTKTGYIGMKTDIGRGKTAKTNSPPVSIPITVNKFAPVTIIATSFTSRLNC